MARVIFGYVIAVIGLILLASTVIPQNPLSPFLQGFLGEDNKSGETIIIIASIILVAAGAFIIVKLGPGKSREVPIYHKKEIVGYRRI
ncbi:hypothetical protein COU62_03180 [Candidatus Pacearchaeota archaeon CG10_big_fil_rev_8_21_14_0_10_35_219]|nr:hypothetical protein [Candidatus Pacearchaeota archaeon]OIO42055.1 MAG: hypothetical protein AUJ63_04150 [Candidatus Pacearchaeota archaeon CG1_02_35_32]PIO07625.1 MAG: hypothetical protein COU62_03180 [Candidatus Pacearchaeota archaeon CG10_big_fil_rev_8_21_14_0_10_35_219]PIY81137.1 MAG: hypothetical protein COY79_04210 [Candidatus Pacearchaeota archaeon CG_4_10_14_0_8_um_filter_35_169]PIZ79734.1 MAG: hypothetical protein COY00_03570 [Candidatus Pacearchaeota archaeon CG_4_10_14_0_2_um_filt